MKFLPYGNFDLSSLHFPHVIGIITYLKSSKPVIFTYNMVQTFPYGIILQHNFNGYIISCYMNMLLCI